MKKILTAILVLAAIFAPIPTYARGSMNLDSTAVILMEQTTGRILYSRNERVPHYPAHATKMLTALVALEFLSPETELTIGDEIRPMPTGFPANTHAEGDTVTVYTLLHSLLIRSASESARVLALNVARQIEGRRNLPQPEAERIFAIAMNEKARSLGTTGSHFNNPLGVHSENHFTTALDLAIITRAFMEEPLLAQIAATRVFEYNERTWTSVNQMLPDAPHGHPYIIGAMTGNTAAAGHVFAAAAHDTTTGLQVVSIVLGSTEAARWQDTRRLIDHAFINFAFREIVRENDLLATVDIENPRQGDLTTLDIHAAQSITALLSREEYAAITKTINFDPLLYAENESPNLRLRAPIAESATVGTVVFATDSTTGGNALTFEVSVIAAREVINRSFDSDMDYFLANFFGNIFSMRGLPWWLAIFGTFFGIVGTICVFRTRRRIRRDDSRVYGAKSRYR